MQGPQDYRDGAENLFKSMCYEEYRGFFHIGMVERNEHDAIIQHGTMTIVRKDALSEVGGWSDWCITEDTELGLKPVRGGLRRRLYSGEHGQGLTPDTLRAFITQRYRWVYGAMQIVKHHAGAFFLGRTELTWAQRYQFLCRLAALAVRRRGPHRHLLRAGLDGADDCAAQCSTCRWRRCRRPHSRYLR